MNQAKQLIQEEIPCFLMMAYLNPSHLEKVKSIDWFWHLVSLVYSNHELFVFM